MGTLVNSGGTPAAAAKGGAGDGAGSGTPPSGGRAPLAGTGGTTGGSLQSAGGDSSTNGGSGNGGVGAAVGAGGMPSSVSGGAPMGGASTGGAPAGGASNGGAAMGGAAGNSSGGSAGQACPALPGAPPGTSPLPTALQVAYQRLELTGFIHLGMPTFDDTEHGDIPSDKPSIFNPTKLDASVVADWVKTFKDAGFKQVMLTAKHDTGFCLWPSQYTDFSVKSCPWMNGLGDIERLFVDAIHAAGLRAGLYLAPWDQTYTSSSPNYETYYKNQLTELLTQYGPFFELELDGFNAPTSNVNWKSIFALARQTEPNLLVWAGPEIGQTGATPQLQWIGNENGRADRGTSSVDDSNCGADNVWCPYECNISDRMPNWFWHSGQGPMTLSTMQSAYFNTVGMNCTFLFSIPPTTTGEFDTADVALMQSFATWYANLYKTDLVKGQTATADSTWASAGFEAKNAVDDDVCTYWAAADGKTSGRLEVSFASPSTVNLVSIREAIELGERVKQYHVAIKQNGTWNESVSDASGTKIKGTVVGQRQLWQTNLTNVEAIALVVDSAKAPPAIAEFSAY